MKDTPYAATLSPNGFMQHGRREAIGPTYMGIMDFPSEHEDILIGEDYMRTRRFWLSYATQTLFVQRQADEKE